MQTGTSHKVSYILSLKIWIFCLFIFIVHYYCSLILLGLIEIKDCLVALSNNSLPLDISIPSNAGLPSFLFHCPNKIKNT